MYSVLWWKLYLNICIFTFCPRAGRGKNGVRRARWGTGLKTGDIFQKITQRGRQWLHKVAHNICPTITKNILTNAWKIRRRNFKFPRFVSAVSFSE